jgi:hypothetical protein
MLLQVTIGPSDAPKEHGSIYAGFSLHIPDISAHLIDAQSFRGIGGGFQQSPAEVATRGEGGILVPEYGQRPFLVTSIRSLMSHWAIPMTIHDFFETLPRRGPLCPTLISVIWLGPPVTGF